MKKVLLLCAAASMFLISCKKEETQKKPHEVKHFSDLRVPANFDFTNHKSLQLDITVESDGSNFPSKIEVYDYLPTAGGGLIYSGFTSADVLNEEINVAAGLSNIYLVKTSPQGSSTMVVKPMGEVVSHAFGKGKTAKSKTAVVSPDCNTGCNQTISSGGWININSPGVYCITGNINGINDNSGNATIRVCGNVTVSGNISLNGSSQLQLTANSSLQIQQVLFNSYTTALTVFPGATLTTSGNMPVFGTLVNHGTINTPEFYSHNTFTNNGSFNVSSTGYSTINNPNAFTNNNSMVVNGHLTVQNSANVINNCSMWIKKSMQLGGGEVKNYEYIRVDENLHLNSNTQLKMYDGAMVVAASMNQYFDGQVTGFNGTSLLKVNGTVNVNSNGRLQGNLEVCISGSNNITATHLITPAVLACAVYIPSSSCNPVGNGTPVISDADNDGVADANDLFPNDPLRAGEQFFPSSTTFATVAFEDLWPFKGDYDFNDVVINYRTRYVTNAAGNAVDIQTDYVLRAIGGSLRNGFGIQYDQLSPSDISSVSRSGTFAAGNNAANGTENGQSRAVIIFFDDAFDLFPNVGGITINTYNNLAYHQPDTHNVSLTLNSPKSISNIPGNPFIYTGGDRGKEIHLSGKIPTDLANSNYFQSGDDATVPGENKYYVTDSNLPWAIMTSSNWAYPTEKNDIVNSYLKFASWAESGGSSFPNWSSDLVGYRELNNIYNN